MLSLQCEVIKRWHQVCCRKIGKAEQGLVYQAIHNYMFGDLCNTAIQTNVNNQTEINDQFDSNGQIALNRKSAPVSQKSIRKQQQLTEVAGSSTCHGYSQQKGSQLQSSQQNTIKKNTQQLKSKESNSQQQKSKQQIKAA